MALLLGTSFGLRFGYPLRLHFCKIWRRWARRRAQFDALPPRPRRHDEQTANASRRAKSNDAARAPDGLARGVVLCSTWRAAMHLSSASTLHFKFAVTKTRSQQRWHHCLRIKASLERAPTANICVAIRGTARQRFTPTRTRPRRIAARRLKQRSARIE